MNDGKLRAIDGLILYIEPDFRHASRKVRVGWATAALTDLTFRSSGFHGQAMPTVCQFGRVDRDWNPTGEAAGFIP